MLSPSFCETDTQQLSATSLDDIWKSQLLRNRYEVSFQRKFLDIIAESQLLRNRYEVSFRKSCLLRIDMDGERMTEFLSPDAGFGQISEMRIHQFDSPVSFLSGGAMISSISMAR